MRYTVQTILETEVEADDSDAAVTLAKRTSADAWQVVDVVAAPYSSHGFGEMPDDEEDDDEGQDYDHGALPDDDPEPGDRCKVCGEAITWIGPSFDTDWMHVNDKENR